MPAAAATAVTSHNTVSYRSSRHLAVAGITLSEVRQRLQNTAIPARDAFDVTPLGTRESLQLAPVRCSLQAVLTTHAVYWWYGGGSLPMGGCGQVQPAPGFVVGMCGV
jgi:hypothetical protein